VALPYLTKYIYNNGTDEVIRRGKKIHSAGNVELVNVDDLMGSVTFRVKDDMYSTYYKVYIDKYKDEKNLAIRCGCPYNLGEICRHEAAALFQLQEMMDKNMLGEKDITYNQRHTVIKMKQLEMKTIKLLSSPDSLDKAEAFLNSSKASIIEAKDERVVAEIKMEEGTYRVVIQKNEERNFDTSCNCDSEQKHPLCVHKTIILIQLLNNFGPTYFDRIRNWDKEKNKLLSLYGYSLEDDIKGKFEFTYKDDKPFLRVLDTSIKRIAPGIVPVKPKPVLENVPTVPAEDDSLRNRIRLGLVITYNAHNYPYVQIDIVQGDPNEENTAFIGKVERLDVARFVITDTLEEEDRQILQQVRKILNSEVSRYLNRNSPFSGIWENIVQQHDDELPEETRQLIIEYLHPKYKKLFTDVADSNFTFFLPRNKPLQTANLKPANCSINFIIPELNVHFTGTHYEVTCTARTPLGNKNVADNVLSSSLLFQQEDQFYLWQKPEDVLLVEKFLPSGKIIAEPLEWNYTLQNFILPLTKEYNVNFSNIQKEEIRDVKPEVKVYLKEKGDYLLFQPVFTYHGYDVKPSDKENILLPQANKLMVIHRNMAVEKAFVDKLKNLHSNFVMPENNNTLALRGAEVLKNNWFFLFIDAVREMNVPVYGFDALKNFRFNTAKPSTKIYISSHTDWFDAKIDIHFGEQKVTVEDVKKALANKQQFVHLQDGTLGILPEEWIKKYSLLFRVGDGRTNDIKLSKYHFSVIEELYEQRDEEELVFQLESKYEHLKENYSINPIPAPEHLQKVLRPYQTSGYQWLNYLHEVQWGGILADDMGLGKTLQTLCFLQYLKETKGQLKALVVCPTTLMFNWENEIKKFTPILTYYTHHGSLRAKDTLIKTKSDIIITTYGTLRSDIKQFIEVPFDYVILDESQAIKNPSSKVTKAVCLLRAKSRLCLSGTPLQNNTFDIYAQMNFLNPGMLGSMDHFKNEFAIPIDKFGEKEQKEHLRKLLYPFILRRTKEQVAKDLPEKQEMILFCEMGDEQRAIYDAYRNDFRDKILGVVEAQGIQRSQLSILQGLMKLRQICDSPAIMKDEEQYPNVSVKLEELGREITENIGNHKALVFSQFLGMLALIKDKLKELEVPFEYFDGSTSAGERERAINRFQNDDECRVFLISLKAGGVGLNLTAADYVYIVDPWWNPAVEQQAIDRTHRIGQTKNIFAYRMICKDTVEDKILQLQDRKRALAADLITDDSTFVKSLTKEDIEYLFS
jgi:hypothetical protein